MRPLLALTVSLLLIGCGSQAATDPDPTIGPSTSGASEVPVSPAASAIASAEPPVPPSAPRSAAVDTPEIAAARQMIETVDLASDETIDQIGGTIRFTAAGERAARGILESASDTDILWAAIWVYASSGSDPAPLRPALEHGDASIRVMAAACLTALGDSSGFEVLRESLVDDAQLLGSRPPRSIRDHALDTLFRYMPAEGVPSPPATADEVAAVATGWSDWLGQHHAALQFDQTDGTWGLR